MISEKDRKTIVEHILWFVGSFEVINANLVQYQIAPVMYLSDEVECSDITLEESIDFLETLAKDEILRKHGVVLLSKHDAGRKHLIYVRGPRFEEVRNG